MANKQKINEDALLKALNQLEDMVAKGDPLEEADPEGGFSTEGTPLSDRAPKGKVKISKAAEESDTESDDDANKSVKKAKVKKAMPQKPQDAADESSTGDDDKSGDEDDDDDDDTSSTDDADAGGKMGKSFAERVNEDETLRKSVEVSDFISSLVDQNGDHLTSLEKSFNKAISGLGGQLRKSIGEHFEASTQFNIRMARAVVMLGKSLRDVQDTVKNFSNTPHVPQRRALLSKSEIVEREFEGNEGDPFYSLSRERVEDWLVQKSMEGKISTVEVTMFEQSGFNPKALSATIRKALINDLSK